MPSQPALLYLVPCTLGTVLCIAWRRGELRQLLLSTKTGAALYNDHDSDAADTPGDEVGLLSGGQPRSSGGSGASDGLEGAAAAAQGSYGVLGGRVAPAAATLRDERAALLDARQTISSGV